MNFLKRNILLIVAVPAIAVILACYIFLGLKSNDATFYLNDIYGDRVALKGITISGYLQDRYHHQFFQIANGEVDNKFRYYNDTSEIIEPKVNYANGLAHDGKVYWYQYEYKIAKDANTVKETKTKDTGAGDVKEVITQIGADKVNVVATVRVRSEDFNINIPDDYILVNTDIYLKSESKEFIFESTRHESNGVVISQSSNDTMPARELNSMDNTLAVANDSLFFTIPVTGKYSGTSGIYKLEEFGVWFNEERPGKVKTITELDLDGYNIDVLGLESVGENLLLVLAIDNVLTFRMFDLNGNMIDEASVPDLDGSLLYRYDSFTDDSMIHFSFGIDRESFIMDGPLVSVSFKGGKLAVEHVVMNLDLNNEIARCQIIDSIDGKLYIVASTTDNEVLSHYTYSYLAPRHLKIFVYERQNSGSKLLYIGELATDINEDFRKYMYSSEPVSNYYNNREFVGIEIQPEREGDF